MNISPIQGAERLLPIPAQAAVTPVQPAATASDPDNLRYYSPALTIDPATGTDVLQIRDSTTGKVKAQYPSEKDIKAYQQKSLEADAQPKIDTTHYTKVTDAKPVATFSPATVSTSATAGGTAHDTVATTAVSAAASAVPASPRSTASIIV